MNTIFSIALLIILGLYGWVVLRRLPMAANIFRIYFGVRRRQGKDITPDAPQPPAEGLASLLTAQGFRQVGATQVDLPGGKQDIFTWHWLNADGTLHAEQVTLRLDPLLERLRLATWFGDHVTVETGYPGGETLDFPDFRSRIVRTSLPDTLRIHLQSVNLFTDQHGPPQKIETLAEILRRDALYRHQFARRKMRRIVKTTALILAWYLATWGYVALIWLVFYGLSSRPGWGTAAVLAGMLVVMALTAAIFSDAVANREQYKR